ncbi:hypothetical protein [Pseudoduganella sp. OTU4001]|uniref:hypothetical protein n=1 Tax=Pseudoduganella sp. OTU4001 TaxID=3043854 RepID=UPI00313B9429
MILIPALLAIVIGTLVVGLVAQLVMLMSRRYKLTWRHGFEYGALVTVAGLAGVLLRFFSGIALPAALGAAIAFAFHALMGAWFLGVRAKDRDGHPAGFLRGALFGLLVLVLVLAAGFAFGALQGVMEVQRGAVDPGI